MDDQNRYAYVGNDPLDKTDPTGDCFENCRDLTPEQREVAGPIYGAVADFIPVVGAIKGIVEAVQNPTALNVGAAIVGAIPEVGAVAKDTLKVGGQAVRTIKDSEVVVRGGTKELPAAGEKFSGAAGSTLEDAAQGVPHGTIRATTAGDIRASGGSVVHNPEPTRSGAINEKHVDVCMGSGPCTFGPPMPNPVPKADRIL